MTCADFIKRVMQDQQHAKRLKMYREGHTEEEIAYACKVEVEEIRAWQKKNILPKNSCLTVMARKPQSVMSKGMIRDYAR